MEGTGGKEVVGLGLSSSIPAQSTSTIIKNETSHDIAQPSPPPPYGPVPVTSLDPLSTPPTQDIEDDPLDNVHTESTHEEDEEEQRRERAADLAKSLGLALLSPSKLSTDENVDDGLDAEEIRKQLVQMKRRLKIRDHGMSDCFKGK
jgi:type IV secretory pathway VirB10-like protein